MSGAKLNTLILKELLQSLPNNRSESDEQRMTYTQICQLPDHYQIYDEPDELQTELGFEEFRHPNRRKWAQILNHNNITTINIYCSDDPYDKIRYPAGIDMEGHIILKGLKKLKMTKRFKHLISKERAEEIKGKRDEEHVLAIKEFESQIDTDDLKQHIKKWTSSYFKEVGFYNLDSNVLNINTLAESAYISILTQIFSWYFVTQDKTWEEVLDSNELNIEIGLEYNFFYDYYPMFNKFGEVVSELSNNRLSLKPRHTPHGKISIKYNWYLVKYAKLRCPKMNIKLNYS
jgi:hypothetical protein